MVAGQLAFSFGRVWCLSSSCSFFFPKEGRQNWTASQRMTNCPAAGIGAGAAWRKRLIPGQLFRCGAKLASPLGILQTTRSKPEESSSASLSRDESLVFLIKSAGCHCFFTWQGFHVDMELNSFALLHFAFAFGRSRRTTTSGQRLRLARSVSRVHHPLRGS